MGQTRGDRIRRAREERGWTQLELASRLGYEGKSAHAQVANWEANKGPNADRLEGLIQVLAVDGHWLITGEGTMERDTGTEAIRLTVIGRVANRDIPDQVVRWLSREDGGALDAALIALEGGGDGE